jgi:hypothetical protein
MVKAGYSLINFSSSMKNSASVTTVPQTMRSTRARRSERVQGMKETQAYRVLAN